MNALPGGQDGPKCVSVRLEQIDSIRSQRAMKPANLLDRERVAAPSASGWLSAIALLPGLVATTGAGRRAASSPAIPALNAPVPTISSPVEKRWRRGKPAAHI